MEIKKLFVLIYLLFTTFLPIEFASATEFIIKDIDKFIENAIKDWNIPGIAIAVVKDDKVALMKGYGVKNIDSKEPIDEHTIFGIGSTTKTFTAGLMGILVHEGKLSWDDKVIDHLPDFRLSDPYLTHQITIRDLISHRTGVESNDKLWLGSNYNRNEIVRRIRFIEPSEFFRSRFMYNNLMILVAGQLIARVTNKSWDENIKEKIFKPLDMHASSTSINDFRPTDNLSTPHVYNEEGKLTTIPWFNIDNIGPAGSVNSTAKDMAQWIKVQLNQGTFEGSELWSKSVHKQMHHPQNIGFCSTKGLVHFRMYGLGWNIYDYRGKYNVWHNGATDGMFSVVSLYPEINLGIVILQNFMPPRFAEPLMLRIADTYLGVPKEKWFKLGKPDIDLPQMSKQVTDKDKISNGKPSLSLEQYTGKYINPVLGNAEVKLQNDGLVILFEAYPIAKLQHKHLNTFSFTFNENIPWMLKREFNVFPMTVNFIIDANAKAVKMNVARFGDFSRENEN